MPKHIIQSSCWLSVDCYSVVSYFIYVFVCIHRGGKYQIYFIQCGEQNQYFSRVSSTSENADIFTARDEIYLVFAEKKENFLFILYSTVIQKSKPNFYLVVSRPL